MHYSDLITVYLLFKKSTIPVPNSKAGGLKPYLYQQETMYAVDPSTIFLAGEFSKKTLMCAHPHNISSDSYQISTTSYMTITFLQK